MSDQKDKANSPPPSGRTLALMSGGAKMQAIVPTTLGETFSLAEMVHASGLAPRSVTNAQQLCVIFMKGLEVGLPPMAAMECIGVINGKACLHSDGIPSLLWSHGFKIREWYTGEESLDTTVAHCEITRPEGETYKFAYSAQDAKDNKLWDTREKDSKGGPNQSPWYRYKKRMLRMRCRGWGARDCGSDVLKGIPIFEEQADIELGRDEYRETKPALAIPDDIPEETAPATVAATEAEGSQDEPISNPGAYINNLDEELAIAKTEDVLDEIWEGHQALIEAGRLDEATQRACDDLYAKACKRLGISKD